ncbi:MAG: hypothetical protein ABIP94_06485, partial [Planctomycetota bacterium]
APATGLWFQINEGDAPWVFVHRYHLYDSVGNALLPATSLFVPAFGTVAATSSNLTARTSSVRVWPAGTYYIAVRNPQTPFVAPTVMPAGVVPTGNYMLEVFSMPMDTGSIVTETEAVGTQSNNTTGSAIAFASGQIGRGNVTLSTGTDPSDWWGPIVISTPSTITYQTRDGLTATPMLDTTVNLRDSTGALALGATGGNILDVSTSTAGLHGRVTVSFFLTPGTFYIEVISPGTTAGQSGDYELELSSVIPAPYVAASYATFAANGTCGTAPFPTLVRQFTSEVPTLGNTFARQVTLCPPNAPYILMQGFSSTTANGGAVILPYDMTGVGAPGCTINVDPLVLTVGMTDATGVADLIFLLPSSASLRGMVVFDQVIVQNLLANAFGVQVSNYGRILSGERSY